MTTATMPTLLVGTDCTILTPRHFVDCARLLRTGAEAVFIPVEDGGYILVGLRRPIPALFQSVSWGTPEVMNETRERANALNISLTELPPLWDIDRPEDYDRAVSCGALEILDEGGVGDPLQGVGP